MSSRLYQFSGTSLGAIEWCDPSRHESAVADSWRVEDGTAVALDRHISRFNASAEKFGLERRTLAQFWRAVLEALPRTGAWFPRVEVHITSGGPTLRYREREAPPWVETVSLARGASDPRRTPLTKGPDLDALMALRRSVADVGATEALIMSAGGAVIEGAYSTVALWRAGSSVLSVVGPHWPRIPSVTESVLRDIATQRGIAVREDTLDFEALEGAEVWILSALHGIRLATELHGGPRITSVSGRRDDWQRAWRHSALSIEEVLSTALTMTD